MIGALLLSIVGSAHAEHTHSTVAVLTAASDTGVWDIGLSTGFPWTRARLQRGATGGWTPFVEFDTARWVRSRPAVGISLPWIDRRWRLSGELTAGFLRQTGDLSLQGPSASAALRTGRTEGRVLPYFHAGIEPTVLVDRVIVDTQSGEEITYDSEVTWTLTGALGVGIPLSERLGMDVGLDIPWVDVPKVSLPGLHIGLQLGGPR